MSILSYAAADVSNAAGVRPVQALALPITYLAPNLSPLCADSTYLLCHNTHHILTRIT